MFLKFRKIHWKAPVFSCKFCKIFKNTFFTKHLRATASDNVYLITLSAFSSPTILLSTIEFPIIDGEFGKWSHYSKCSHLCGGEIQNHTRKSNSPAPANGGADCVGTRVETPKCSIKPFPGIGLNVQRVVYLVVEVCSLENKGDSYPFHCGCKDCHSPTH